MLLEEIKKDCKVLTNEEHQGEELYFDKKPVPDIIATLKENGYRWHRHKNCWYRKLDYQETEEKKQQNYLGVKVGDIFVFSWRIRTKQCGLFSGGRIKRYKTSYYSRDSIQDNRNNRI